MPNDKWNFQSRLCLGVGHKSNMRQLVREMLHGVGLESLEFVNDIPAAMPVLNETPYDIVLIEAAEPVAGVISFVEMVRRAKVPNIFEIPIIISHGQLEEGSAELLRDAGVTELLALPVSRQLLLEAMNASLLHPRHFIAASTYRGPDRRREQDSEYKGPKRREIDILAKPLADAWANTERRVFAERRADIELISFLCDTSFADAEKRMNSDSGFAAFLCEGSEEEAHFMDIIDLGEVEPIKEPIKAKLVEAKLVEAKPVEAKPVEAKPVEAKPVEAKPVEAKIVEPVKPATKITKEEGAMTQAELSARLSKRPGQ